MRLLPVIFTACITAATLVACGGGGGTSTPVVTDSPPGASRATPSTTPTPLPLSGVVRDLGAQRFSGDGASPGPAIAGATVVVGPVLITGATPPATLPAGDVAAVTAADGSFTIGGVATVNASYVMVFPSAGDTHVSLHDVAKITGTALQPLHLYNPRADEIAELAQTNTDRAQNGNAPPVIFDEAAFETARAHADFENVNGYYQHCIPSTNCYVNVTPQAPPPTYAPQYVSPDDLYNYLNGAKAQPAGLNAIENACYGGGSTWASCDNFFMAEKAGPIGGTQGHYQNIIGASHVWLGLGDAGGNVHLEEFI